MKKNLCAATNRPISMLTNIFKSYSSVLSVMQDESTVGQR